MERNRYGTDDAQAMIKATISMYRWIKGKDDAPRGRDKGKDHATA